jgi:hypothetical protein
MTATTKLILCGQRMHLEQLLPRVEGLLRGGWKRDRGAEERFGRHGTKGPWDRCFSCTTTADRPAVGIWIHPTGVNELSVSSPISLENSALTQADADRVLAEFERDFLRPAALAVGVEIQALRQALPLELDLSLEAIRLLRAFSASANREKLQLADQRRWAAFLVRVHCDEAFFDPELLHEWLRQEGWPEDTRQRLVAEYEAARSLLAAYDEEIGSR